MKTLDKSGSSLESLNGQAINELQGLLHLLIDSEKGFAEAAESIKPSVRKKYDSDNWGMKDGSPKLTREEAREAARDAYSRSSKSRHDNK